MWYRIDACKCSHSAYQFCCVSVSVNWCISMFSLFSKISALQSIVIIIVAYHVEASNTKTWTFLFDLLPPPMPTIFRDYLCDFCTDSLSNPPGIYEHQICVRYMLYDILHMRNTNSRTPAIRWWRTASNIIDPVYQQYTSSISAQQQFRTHQRIAENRCWWLADCVTDWYTRYSDESGYVKYDTDDAAVWDALRFVLTLMHTPVRLTISTQWSRLVGFAQVGKRGHRHITA